MSMLRSVTRNFVGGPPEPVFPPVTTSGQVCEATLPSSTAVDRLLGGDPWAIPAVVMSTALRGALVGTGLAFAGFDTEDVVKGGVAGALAIEVFVILYVAMTRIRDAKAREQKALELAALGGFREQDVPWQKVDELARSMGFVPGA